MDTYKLEFLIEGDDRTITVTVPRTADVQELTQLIFQVRQLEGLSVFDLKLLKVCHDHNLR
jgi:hypothetical protein